MRRLLLVLALVCLAAGAFAVNVSLGIGASLAYNSWDLKGSYFGDYEDNATRTPWNFMVYADMTYLQIGVGYRTFHGGHETDSRPTGTTEYKFPDLSMSWVSFSAYGKMPLPLGQITFFPMVGIEYDMTVSGTFTDGTDFDSQTKSDNNEFWIKGGIGLDISVSPQVYIRPVFLVGYKLLNKPEQDVLDTWKNSGLTNVSMLYLSFEGSILIGVRI